MRRLIEDTGPIGFYLSYVSGVIAVTVGAALLLAGIGLWLILGNSKLRQDIGVSLFTGALFLLASGLNQLTVNVSSFRDSLSLGRDLTGFDPGHRSLEGFTLAGKDLPYASLSDATLIGADLSYSNLQEAELSDANL